MKWPNVYFTKCLFVGWFFEVIKGHKTDPVIGRQDSLYEVNKGCDNSPGTGISIHKDNYEKDQTDKAQNGRHDGSRNKELSGLVPLEGKEGKAKGDGTENGKNRSRANPEDVARDDASDQDQDSEHLVM